MQKLRKPVSILLSLIMIFSVFIIVPFSVGADSIAEYVDKEWNAQAGEVVDTDKTVTNYTPLTKDMTLLDSGVYVVDSNITYAKRLYIKDNANVGIILCNGFTLENSKGIVVPQTATLTFYGQVGNTGKVNVFNADGAGIGAMDENKAGTMIFKGGHIIAKGGNKDAGIGTGKNSDSGYEEISILGGKIEATGGDMGAGIGAGRENSCNNSKVINIYGGTVKAKGGEYGAGIGGGEDSSVKEINIYGGSVTAKGGDEAAGIGSGNDEDNDGTINIYGGTVKANGGEDGAGIGGGDDGDGGKINIFGGDITSEGDRDGAGIGGGDDSNGGTITIDGGEVNCFGKDGAGIGGGCDGKEGDITINGGTIKALSHRAAGIGGGYDENTRGSMVINGGLVFALSEGGAGIGGGYHGDLETEVKINNGNVYAASGIKTESLKYSIITEKDFYVLPESKFGRYGAGIGGGGTGSQDSTVYINGGTVHAIGGASSILGRSGHGGAGIGGGAEGYNPAIVIDGWISGDTYDGGESADVVIKEGATLIAAGGVGSCSIGHGDDGDELGNLTIPDDYSVFEFKKNEVDVADVFKAIKSIKTLNEPSELLAFMDEAAELVGFADKNKRVEACRKKNHLIVVKPCKHSKRTYDVTTETHTLICNNCLYEKTEPHVINEDLCVCKLFNDGINKLTTVTLTDPVSARAFTKVEGLDYELPEGRNTEPDANGKVKKFTGWKRNDVIYQPGDIVTVEKDMKFGHTYENNYLVTYADDMEHGHLSADVSMAPEGATVTVKPRPDYGYQLKRIWYIREDHGVGELWDLDKEEGSTAYTITMPKSKIILHAEFEQRSDIHKHGDTVFEPYPGAESIGDEGTYNYFLTEDSVAPDHINTLTTVNICLNGHKLIIPDDGLSVYPGSELNIHDCSYDSESIVNDDGIEELIVNESASKGVISGGRITVMGMLNMYGGNITGSQGVRIDGYPGVFNMYGGKIEGNTSSTHGAGVYVVDGDVPNVFNICGDVSIRNNKYTGGGEPVEENVYLEQYAEIRITTDEPLTNATKIGVTSAGNQIPVTITSALDGKAAVDNFFSDNDDYIIAVDRGGHAQLQGRNKLSFDATDGEGYMEPDSVGEEYYLPGCDFTPPEGLAFIGWKINDKVYQPGDKITLTQDATAYAQWGTVSLFILGDADGDGNVTALDVTWIQRSLASMEVSETFNEAAADVDGDGLVTIIDVTMIQRYLANMDVYYPIGKNKV